VADVVYRDVIVLTPKEWHGDELLSSLRHVERGGLALALGDNPVLDADVLAIVRIGPTRDVARCEDSTLVSRWASTITPRSRSLSET
jgi:hypothetical protein